MPRLILPLVLLLAACNSASNIQMPNFALQPAPLVAPRGGEASTRCTACRQEATRVGVFRERGQTMRADDLGSSPGSFGNTTSMATYQSQMDRAAAEAEVDRLTRACMASPDASAAAGATTGR